MKIFFALGISLILLSDSLAQTISNPSDFFPLNSGRKWIYSYKSLEIVYWDLASLATETKDSGTIQYTAIGIIHTDTSQLWSIQEQDSIFRFVHNYDSGTDSSYKIIGNPTFQFTEMVDSLHTLFSSSYFPPFTFPVQWGLRSGSPLFRYGLDSTFRLISEYQYIGGSTWNFYDTLLFQRDVGLINAKSTISKGPNTPYYFEWEAALTSIVTGVNDLLYSRPKSFYRLQNYPNPFNPTTVISFSLPAKSFVSLSIYDMLGRRIDRLINCYLGSGVHQILWNAANNASGVYLCKLGVGEKEQMIKLILLR